MARNPIEDILFGGLFETSRRKRKSSKTSKPAKQHKKKEKNTRQLRKKLWGKSKVIKKLDYQIGARKSVSADKKRKAKAPGKRRTAWGTVYWETRKNRSDLKGKL